ncbi:MAG: hypothetical protein AB7I30_13750 [Isosphaeraceae bacterium]
MTSAAKIEANRRNASRSTGPKTAEGKARSSRNALAHGLTASTQPDHDPEYQSFLRSWLDDAKPAGPIEQAMVERAAHAAWRLKTSARQEDALRRFHARRAADLHDQAERERAVRLGERLIQDPLNRCAVFLKYKESVMKRVAEWRLDDPAVLSGELELTQAGVDWKLARWEELARMLQIEGFWHYDARYKALKLAGHRPEDTLHDPVVERITLACNALHPEAWDLWDECFQATLGTEGRPVYRYRVALFQGRKPGKDEALATLEGFVEAEVARLRALRDRLDPTAERERVEAADRVEVEDAPRASPRVRYESAATRAMHVALAELARLRKARRESEEDSPKDVTPEPRPSKRPADPPRNEPRAHPQNDPSPALPARPSKGRRGVGRRR